MREIQVIRRFVPADVLAALARHVLQAYETVDAGDVHPDFAITRSWDGLAVPHLKAHLNGAEPINAMARVIESRFPGARVVDDECSFRRHRTGATHIGWHTDADAAGSAQYDPCFNVWLPLMPVGGELPSLEVVSGSDPLMRTMPAAPMPTKLWPDEWRRQHFPRARIVCPRLDPGDVLLFSHYTLHRTQPKPHRGTRVSGEMRFTMKGAPKSRWQKLFERVCLGRR